MKEVKRTRQFHFLSGRNKPDLRNERLTAGKTRTYSFDGVLYKSSIEAIAMY
jgi:hypothetical protein